MREEKLEGRGKTRLTIVTNSTEEVLDVRTRQPAEGLKAQRRVLRDTSGVERLSSSRALSLGDLLRRALQFGDCRQLNGFFNQLALPFPRTPGPSLALSQVPSGLVSSERGRNKLGTRTGKATTMDSPSTAALVHSIPLPPAWRISRTSRSLFAFPVTKTVMSAFSSTIV